MFKNITMSQFSTLDTTAIHILDVREEDEFKAGHIEGAKNAPLSRLTMLYAELDTSKAYYVICHAGVRSVQAAMFLESVGFEVVNVLEGMNGWQGPIVR
ncbi:rhodanese-like domain-containing protein [Peptoniphilus equinus]|uniref:Rhodanese-like domain-containing protein n=1 Tax=Peptoniphilus equinus TaxID=3016343 RepID=A0ABY7QV26_9FIRM|nr:rhodanese-like domain-containing protein [Peptoniphilus equinus]WBW50634.1 rhodanese-like domain-containing protein [Peptoniphilus equinus]